MVTVDVIAGPMFSGKTEELIRRLRRASYAGKRILVIKPKIDTRTENKIVARLKKSEVKFEPAAEFPAYPVESLEELEKLFKETNPEILGIDEAQFLKDWFLIFLYKLLQNSAQVSVTVIIVGLDKDAWGKPFGIMPQLMALADHVDKEEAVCFKCGSLNAVMTQKKSLGSGEQIEVGDFELYEARCRICWTPPREISDNPA